MMNIIIFQKFFMNLFSFSNELRNQEWMFLKIKKQTIKLFMVNRSFIL